MSRRRPRLPSRVVLGGGYVIKVVLMPAAWIAEEAEVEVDDGVRLQGLWSPEHGADPFGTIYIDKALGHAQRWDVYWHELVHAVNDVMAWDRDRQLTI